MYRLRDARHEVHIRRRSESPTDNSALAPHLFLITASRLHQRAKASRAVPPSAPPRLHRPTTSRATRSTTLPVVASAPPTVTIEIHHLVVDARTATVSSNSVDPIAQVLRRRRVVEPFKKGRPALVGRAMTVLGVQRRRRPVPRRHHVHGHPSVVGFGWEVAAAAVFGWWKPVLVAAFRRLRWAADAHWRLGRLLGAVEETCAIGMHPPGSRVLDERTVCVAAVDGKRWCCRSS